VGFNTDGALRRDIYVSAERVGARAARFPRIASLLGDRLADVLGGDRKRADAAPLLLRLLDQEGIGSAEMLAHLEAGLRHFDELEPGGWTSWKATLAGADRPTCLSRYSELLLALAFESWGHRVCAFEPSGAVGNLADLSVELAGETVLVETSSPGPHENDWIDRAMERLSLALSRVQSGLTIEVRGYEALRFSKAGGWSSDAAVSAQAIDDLVNEFCRRAEHIDCNSLPHVVIRASEGQPVTITVTAGEQNPKRTEVCSFWNRSGLVPNVKRLAQKFLDERHHLSAGMPGLVLIDLRMWPDFRDADFHLRGVEAELTGHALPTVAGTFVSDNRDGIVERRMLHIDERWRATPAGNCFEAAWCE
jgi:hypothetical protein